MEEYSRSERVAEVIQRELAKLLQRGLKDPRLPKMTTITKVSVSPDFSHAKVYYTVLAAEQNQALAGEVLKHAAGYLRQQLRKTLTTRNTPELHFFYDDFMEKSQRLAKIIADAPIHDDNDDDEESASD